MADDVLLKDANNATVTIRALEIASKKHTVIVPAESDGTSSNIGAKVTSLLGYGGALGSAMPAGGMANGIKIGSNLQPLTGVVRGAENALSVQLVDASGNQVTSFGSASAAVSTYHLITAGSANAGNIKASAGTLYSIHIYNNAGYPVYAKFHNDAGTPTAGVGVVLTVGVQAGSHRDCVLPGGGRSFGTGIAITVVKDIADAGATAVVASDAQIEVCYA